MLACRALAPGGRGTKTSRYPKHPSPTSAFRFAAALTLLCGPRDLMLQFQVVSGLRAPQVPAAAEHTSPWRTAYSHLEPRSQWTPLCMRNSGLRWFPSERGAGACRTPADRKEPCKQETAGLRCGRSGPPGLQVVGGQPYTGKRMHVLSRVKTQARFKSVRKDEGLQEVIQHM